MGVDGLAGDAGRGGDVFHAGIGSLAEYGAGRVEDGVDASLGVGPAAAGRQGGIKHVSHQGEDTCPAIILTSCKSYPALVDVSQGAAANSCLS